MYMYTCTHLDNSDGVQYSILQSTRGLVILCNRRTHKAGCRSPPPFGIANKNFSDAVDFISLNTNLTMKYSSRIILVFHNMEELVILASEMMSLNHKNDP